MHFRKLVIVLVTLAYISLSAQAQVTDTSTDTPVSGATGSPITSTIAFSVSGAITAASIEVAINVGVCGTSPNALTLTGPGGSVMIMDRISDNAGDIFLIPDLASGAGSGCGDCVNGCGSAGAPFHYVPVSGLMSVFSGQTSDASSWVLSLDTSNTAQGCGPYSINAWSLTLNGNAPLPVEVVEFSVE